MHANDSGRSMRDHDRAAVAALDIVTRTIVRRRLGLPRIHGESFFNLLHRHGFSQADLVLCLLHLNTPQAIRGAELIVGRPVTHCPSSLLLTWRWKRTALRQHRQGDDRLVLAVYEPDTERCLPNGGLRRRLEVVHAGMSVGQLLARGVRRRDVRFAVKRGFVELEAAA